MKDLDRRRRGSPAGWTALLALLAWGSVTADERILDFTSEIEIRADASVTVSETLTVRAEGREIRRGIYRDFPTDYRDRAGNRVRVAFDVLQVLRDDRPEPWHSERTGDGVRVYIGHKDRLLERGEYSYTLVYRTDRQLGFFADHDELYWNVTGDGWAFPIDAARALVRLPPGVPDTSVQLDAYTGPRGVRGRDFRAGLDTLGRARIDTTRTLRPGEGLTIAVGWPKGFVHAPALEERLGWLLSDNADLLAGVAGGLLVLGWYLFAWLRVGRDPEEGVVFPRYEPPAGFSPASLRFVRRMAYDQRAFSAALVNLAVNGHLRIHQEGKAYRLERLRGTAPLAPGEQALLGKLFGNGTSIDLVQRNHERVRAALKAHQASLRRDYEKRYFLRNRSWLLPGALLSLLTFVACLLLLPNPEALSAGLFMTVWLSGWTAGVVALLGNVIGLLRRASSTLDYLAAIPAALFALPFVGAELFGLGMLGATTSSSFVVILLLLIGVNALFYQLMKAPTRAGRELLDRVDGFRLYLDVAEGEELALRSGPERTPELFERYLPYAIALDLEARWAERFAAVLAAAAAGSAGYHPAWYRGGHWDGIHAGGFANAIGSGLSSAVASSSSAPGSSSGGGGGGSSGGGGGGGGGGGW